jgi:hypothetical protein
VADLKYGPVGDPNSDDPFERAQAQAPWGWHVEGQAFRIGHGIAMQASGPGPDGQRVWVRGEGSRTGAPRRLVAAMLAAAGKPREAMGL